MTSLQVSKGQGTGNDFVLFSDPDGEVSLDADDIAALHAAVPLPRKRAGVPML